jgi:drug/metabolite transporter (DMT)-like permease
MDTTRNEGSTARAAGWIGLSIAAWSLVPLVANRTGGLSPNEFLLGSHLMSTLTLAAATWATGHAREFTYYSATDIRRLAALGGLGIFLYYALLFDAYAPCAFDAPCGHQATLVLVVHYSWPIFTVLLSWLLLAEAPQWRTAVAVVCGALAIASAATAEAHGHAGSLATPKAIGAAMAFGLYGTLSTRIRYDPLSGATIMFGSAAALSLATVLISWSGQSSPALLRLDGATAATMIVSGVVVNGLSHVFWQRALRAAPETSVRPWIALTPLAAGASFALGTGAVLGRLQWIGLALVLASAFLALRPTPKGGAPTARLVRSFDAIRRLAEESI